MEKQSAQKSKCVEGASAPPTRETAEMTPPGVQKKARNLQPTRLCHHQEAVTPTTHRPANSEPSGRKRRPRGDERTTVPTASGKLVLSSDARLHLEKVKRKAIFKESQGRDLGAKPDSELLRLERERQLLEQKITHKREIHHLQLELHHSESDYETTEYQRGN